VNELDTAAAFAWVEQRLLLSCFASAYSASICIAKPVLPASKISGILRIVHDVRACTCCGVQQAGDRVFGGHSAVNALLNVLEDLRLKG
jgi:hypothetical protein